MEKQQNNKDFFETKAILYGSDAVLIPGGSRLRNKILNTIMKNRITPILNEFENTSFLEIGSGVGRWSKILSKRNFVVGIDISRYMVQEAKKSVNNEKCFFVVADAPHLPFKDGAFDFVISITVLQHILDQPRLLEAISEISNCSRKSIIIIEEMWSEMTLRQAVYYPIKISSASFYIEELSSHGYTVKFLKGLTFAPLTIVLVKLFICLSHFISFPFKSNLKNQKKSKSTLGMKIINFALGVSLLSDLIYYLVDSKKSFDPRLSLHTLIHFEAHQHNLG